jgi:dTDP-4-dehydrorhamnose reductase
MSSISKRETPRHHDAKRTPPGIKQLLDFFALYGKFIIYYCVTTRRGLIEMKVLLLGSTGMLGSECKRVLSKDHEIITPNRKELDIISWDVVIENIQRIHPDIVLNCAGFTDVKACESEAFLVRKTNVEGPRNLAQVSARFHCKLIHISCDSVFDGQKVIPQPYFEDDPPNPLSAYGRSKVESEVAVRENSPNYMILRTGWLYGADGSNFVRSFIDLSSKKRTKVVNVPNTHVGSPTWTYRLAMQIKTLLDFDGRGTYHATAEDYCSRLECGRYIVSKLGLKKNVEPLSVKKSSKIEQQPMNFILENRRLKNQGKNVMVHWREDLEAFLERHRESLLKPAKNRKG